MLPDSRGPLQLEQPAEITTEPLSTNDQDDRIRMVFGLGSNDPLPDVDDATLETYREYLIKKLALPFRADYRPERGKPERIKVIQLGDLDDEPLIDATYGILCTATANGRHLVLPLDDLRTTNPNRQSIDDYRHWFGNYR